MNDTRDFSRIYGGAPGPNYIDEHCGEFLCTNCHIWTPEEEQSKKEGVCETCYIEYLKEHENPNCKDCDENYCDGESCINWQTFKRGLGR